MAINQSKLKLYRRCQKAYSFKHGEYAPEGMEMQTKYPSLPLKRGGWMHLLQEALHREWAGIPEWEIKVGRTTEAVTNWKEVQSALTREFEQMFAEEKEAYGPLPDETRRLFRAYLRNWREDSDRYTVARLHDGSPAIEFLVEVDLRPWGIEDSFKGRVDLMVEDSEYGGLWVWDAKWVKKVPSPDERMMSPQSLLYVWALRKADYDVRGFVYNYGRTKPPTMPAVLKKGVLTTRASLDSDVYTYVEAIKALHGSDWKNFANTIYREKLRELNARNPDWFRRERVPITVGPMKQAVREMLVTAADIQRRTTTHPPRSYFYNCKFSCDFHDICVAEFQGLDIQPLIKQNFEFTEERYAETEDLLSA
jgi:hypothetical protein